MPYKYFLTEKPSFFAASDWGIYVFTPIFSMGGFMAGAKIFDLLKDNQNIIKGILAILIFLYGIILLIYSLDSGL